MSWPLVALAEVAPIARAGIAPEKIATGTIYVGLENIDGAGDFIGVDAVNAGELASTKFRFTEQQILFGKLRPYLKKIARPNFSGVCSTDILPLSPAKHVDRDYLFHVLRRQSFVGEVTSLCAGANLPRISPRVLADMQVPLPPLGEQRHIAAILDKADALRAKRREAIAKLDQLLRSVFLEMFGDPVTNPKCEVVELASLCERVTDGTHQSPKWSQSGVPFLFQSNVKPGEISFDTKKSISVEDYKALTARSPIEYGDVLYTIVGSYGNAAMVRTYEKFCFQRHIAHLKPKEHVLPEFLEGMMNHPSVKRQADERVTGIAQKTLILKELKRLLVVKPSMAQQIEFRKVSQRISESRKTMVASEAKFSDQFESMQSAAFAGML